MNKLKILALLLLLTLVVGAAAQPCCRRVKAGDARDLLAALNEAAIQNADSLSERLYILIPDGYYDLGDTALVTVSGFNVTLVGQSTEGTVIRNAPPVAKEGIGSTATLLNRGHDVYVQDLTLRNDLDYYHSGAAGRAVCWQDKGYRTIFKRVRMLSYQDTYYSHSEECQHYFEDCEIHGTVDFLCGAGDVVFNRCLIVTEKRNLDGSGVNVIAAPRTSTTRWGYVFLGCTVSNDQSPFHFARGWHTLPRCTWIGTRLLTPEKLCKERFDPQSIRSAECEFGEYGTVDAQGQPITPSANTVHIVGTEGKKTVQTTLSRQQASRYTLKNIFPAWRPEKIADKLEKLCRKQWKRNL